MIALIQRVLKAEVEVDGHVVGAIASGLLAFVCAERRDLPTQCDALVRKVLGLRVFDDDRGRMSRALDAAGGGLLVVPQFTLAADTSRGARPSFTPAAEPALARALFEQFVSHAKALHGPVESGRFGAHMRVSLINDGPVTLWLRVAPMGPEST
ncbi:MAG: D-aminoacyl-tRNA deacylase [Burkholderiaceae bacterium]